MMNRCVFPIVVSLLVPAQASSDGLRKKVRLSGQLGTYYEIYTISGRRARRPPNTGRIFVRPTLSLFGLKFSVGADIFATTEQRYRVQQLGRYAINPRWSWGELNLGDFVPRWSRLTLGGVQIRGGGIRLDPGMFRLSAVGGLVLRSSRRSGQEAYRRTQFGVSLGFGRRRGPFFDLMFLRTRDEPGSFVPDTTGGSRIAPQENLVVAANTRFDLFRRKLRFRGEFAGCLHTQDLRSSELEVGDGGPLGELITLRLSSRFDYAFSVEGSVHLYDTSLRGSVKYVGPGYTSLGLAYLSNDRMERSLGFSTRLYGGRVALRGSFRSQHDNLLGQKKYTTTRSATNLGLDLRPTVSAFLGFNANLNHIGNDAGNDTLRVDTSIHGYAAVCNFSFSVRSWTANLGFSYAYQGSRDRNILRRGNDVGVHNVNVTCNLRFGPSFTGSSNFSLSSTGTAQQGAFRTLSCGAGVSYRGLSDRLTSSLSLSLNSSGGGSSLGTVFSSNLRLTAKDNLHLSFRNTAYLPDGMGTVQGYNETVLTASCTRRF